MQTSFVHSVEITLIYKCLLVTKNNLCPKNYANLVGELAMAIADKIPEPIETLMENLHTHDLQNTIQPHCNHSNLDTCVDSLAPLLY
jgi:hypothetical protein